MDVNAIRPHLPRSRIFSTSLHPWMKPTDHGHFLPLADLRCPIQCGQYRERSDSHPHTASGESYPEQWYDSASPTDGSVRWEAKFSWTMLCKEEEDKSNWLQALITLVGRMYWFRNQYCEKKVFYIIKLQVFFCSCESLHLFLYLYGQKLIATITTYSGYSEWNND